MSSDVSPLAQLSTTFNILSFPSWGFSCVVKKEIVLCRMSTFEPDPLSQHPTTIDLFRFFRGRREKRGLLSRGKIYSWERRRPHSVFNVTQLRTRKNSKKNSLILCMLDVAEPSPGEDLSW